MPFITFEGGEGSGKTTQVKLLSEYLSDHGVDVVTTREPGGTLLAEELRRMVLGGERIKDPMTEFLAITTGRRDHIENLIKPSLTQGKWVISDRFFDSSVVFQGYCTALGVDVVNKLNSSIFGDFKPDLTFLIDLDPSIAKKRMEKREGEKSFFDLSPLSWYQKVRKGYLKFAKTPNRNVILIDGNKDISAIHEEIKEQTLKEYKI